MVNLSTITQMESYPSLERGNPTTKSIVILSHFHSRIGRGWSFPDGFWCSAFTCWQINQEHYKENQQIQSIKQGIRWNYLWIQGVRASSYKINAWNHRKQANSGESKLLSPPALLLLCCYARMERKKKQMMASKETWRWWGWWFGSHRRRRCRNEKKRKKNGEGLCRKETAEKKKGNWGKLHFDPSSFHLLFDKIIFNNATFIHIHTNIQYISTPNTHIC